MLSVIRQSHFKPKIDYARIAQIAARSIPESRQIAPPFDESVVHPEINRIARAVGEHYHVPHVRFYNSARLAMLVVPRTVFYYLLRTHSRLSLPGIVRGLRGAIPTLNHSTIIGAANRCRQQMATDSELRERIERLERELGFIQ